MFLARNQASFPAYRPENGPSVLVVGRDTENFSILMEDVALAGGHVRACVSICREPKQTYPAADFAVVIASCLDDEDVLVEALCHSSLPRPSLIISDLKSLDLVYALAKPDDEICVSNSRAERLAAMSMLVSRTGRSLRETSYVLSETALHQIQSTVAHLAKQLGELSNSDQGAFSFSTPATGSSGSPAQYNRDENALITKGAPGQLSPRSALSENDVRKVIRQRRLRARFFNAELFADPAWDILLDLTAAHLGGHRVSASSLCIAACVPPTTALRWIRHMTEQRIVRRVIDRDDRRRVYVELSAESLLAMQGYFKAADVDTIIT